MRVRMTEVAIRNVGPRGAMCGQRRIDKPFVPRLIQRRGPAPRSPHTLARIQRVCLGVWGQSPQVRPPKAACLIPTNQVTRGNQSRNSD